MKRTIEYIRERKWLAIVISLTYFLAVVLPHQSFGVFIGKSLDKPYGRSTYNLIILCTAIILFLAMLLLLYRYFVELHSQTQRKLGFFLLVLLLLIITSINTILVVNIELIHILQYCIMTILLFTIVEDFFNSAIFALILGALDELYQYVILSPERTDYYDFNDVIINFLGAGLSIFILKTLNVKSKTYKNKLMRHMGLISIGLIVVFNFVLWITGRISIYPNKDKSIIFEYIREYKTGFWQEIPPKVTFHIVQPMEACIILVVLALFFAYFCNVHVKTSKDSSQKINFN